MKTCDVGRGVEHDWFCQGKQKLGSDVYEQPSEIFNGKFH